MRTDKEKKIEKKNVILAMISGLLLTCSFPKIGMSWLAWFALVPLLVAIKDLSLKNRFSIGFLSGMVHYMTLFYYMVPFLNTFGPLPIYFCIPILILLATYLSFYTAIFSMMVNRLSGIPILDLFLIPVTWVSLEYIRSFLLTGFPWELLGYSQFKILPVIQISDILGVYGVSFLVVLVSTAIFYGYLHISGKYWLGLNIQKKIAYGAIAIFITLFSLNWVYGTLRIRTIDSVSAESQITKVTVVQGNIEQTLKWNPEFQISTIKKYIRLSKLSKGQKPDLIIWPETAAPFYLFQNPRLTEMIKNGIKGIKTKFLIGSPSVIHKKENFDYYNSAYLIDSDGNSQGKYDKAHLVPFGEYVPLGQWLPFIGKIVANVGDFKPGKPGHILSWGKFHLGTLICYEIIFPNLSRAMAKNGATLLINITNDAWYGKTSAPFQHFSMAVFRAIENRRSLARAANTGISGIIDPAGRIIVSTLLFQDVVETRPISLLSEMTFYTRYGDVFAVACLVLVLTITLWMEIKRRVFKQTFTRWIKNFFKKV